MEMQARSLVLAVAVALALTIGTTLDASGAQSEPNAGSAGYEIDRPMTVAHLNGIDIAYTTIGDPDAPPILMIMGLTASHRLWGDDIVNRLVDAGYRVVLFDNRDTGESSFLDELGEPTIWWQMLKNALGFDMDSPYTLHDMAADGIAVLDVLDIDNAHIVGASMGGMIAQVIATEYPDRTTTLVSIMSTTGAPHLPPAEDDAGQELLDLGGSEGDAAAQLRELGIHPESMPRQLMAIIQAGDRTDAVKTITAPTLVLHGADDPLLPPPHGEHTAQTIGGAHLIIYPGMGHNLPPAVVPKLVDDMVAHFASTEPSVDQTVAQ